MSPDVTVAIKVFSWICSLCKKRGEHGQEGPWNSNYEGTAKSMEAVGMVDCLKDLEIKGESCRAHSR